MTLALKTFPQVAAGYKQLESKILQRRALTLIAKLKKSPFLGQQLEYRGATGNLGDCRKLYFDVKPSMSPSYRIVYRVLPDEDDPKAIEIVSIGKREESAVYEQAALRLGR